MNFRLARPLYRDPYYKYEKQSNDGTGVISQLFGENLAPEFYASLGITAHNGIDLPAPLGTPIYAAHDGWVNQLQLDSSKGLGVHILTTLDYEGIYYETIYWHCEKVLVHIGDRVTRDTVLGTVDSTGHSTGNHLHWGLKKKEYVGGDPFEDSSYKTLNKDNGFGGFIDPLPFLKTMADEYIIVGKEQFFRVSSKWFHITNAEMLRALLDMGVVSGNPKVEMSEPKQDYEIAALKVD